MQLTNIGHLCQIICRTLNKRWFLSTCYKIGPLNQQAARHHRRGAPIGTSLRLRRRIRGVQMNDQPTTDSIKQKARIISSTLLILSNLPAFLKPAPALSIKKSRRQPASVQLIIQHPFSVCQFSFLSRIFKLPLISQHVWSTIIVDFFDKHFYKNYIFIFILNRR